MAKLKFFKVSSLPGTLQSNAIYFVDKSGNRTDMYVTNNSGVAFECSNEAMITAIIMALRGSNNGLASLDGTGKIPEAQLPFTLNDATNFILVDDIAERDNLNLDKDTLVLVVDASADSTVTSGNALYGWRNDTSTWKKVAEFESLDITWSTIVGGPAVTAAQVETAVAQSHTHSNKAALDKIGEDGDGDVTYDGDPVMKWSSTSW